jgi:hypothetical protein
MIEGLNAGNTTLLEHHSENIEIIDKKASYGAVKALKVSSIIFIQAKNCK